MSILAGPDPFSHLPSAKGYLTVSSGHCQAAHEGGTGVGRRARGGWEGSTEPHAVGWLGMRAERWRVL